MVNSASKKLYFYPIAACLLGIAIMGYYYLLSDFSRHENTQYLYVDSDDTADSVFAKLEPIGKQHSLMGLRTLMRHCDYDSQIHTGRYAIQPGHGVFTVFKLLKSGRQAPLMLTIPEVRTMGQLADYLSNKLMADSVDFAEAFADTAVCNHVGLTMATLPSLFVPNTYEVYWNITVDAFLERMKKEHDVFWNAERKQKAQAIGLSPEEVCTLASIIDEETANNAEKPMIAGMYMNRLHAQMPLQADPTVKFALQDFTLRRIYRGMLNTDSPYNTYRNIGLPPGPIKIASIKGIEAVLSYVHHDYLYMCAKEDFSGTHNFAASYNEHLKNAARYAKALNERGVK